MLPAAVTNAATTNFTDGLGTRVRRLGSSGAEEILEFRPELLVNSFEFAVRERVGRLAPFEHPFIARAHRVERARDRRGSLSLVSRAIEGTRLTTLLIASEQRRTAPDPVWALRRVHQILDAVSALHKTDRDVVHGAIGPDRIVISPEVGAIVADYVIGAAIEQLHYSPKRYWTDLGVAAASVGRFTQRLDVHQTGLVALALLLGRRLSEEEASSEALTRNSIASLSGTADRSPLFSDVQRWLRRTLEFDAPFASAAEAADTLLNLIERHATSSAALRDDVASEWAVAPNCPTEMMHNTVEQPLADISQPVHVEPAPLPALIVPTVEPENSTTASDGVSATIAHVEAEAVSVPFADLVHQASPAPQPSGAAVRRISRVANGAAFFSTNRRSWYLGIAAVCLLATAVAMKNRAGQRSAQVADSSLGTLIITTPRAGAAVYIDQTKRGITPITLRMTAGEHVLELRDGNETRTLPVSVSAGGVASQYIELSTGNATVGGLRVQTEPEGALVSVDGVASGRSPVFVKGVRPGQHMVSVTGEFAPINQTVVVEAGAVASVLISRHAPPVADVAGWIGITSPFPVQVFEQDGLIGSSASPRIMLSAGTHRLELVNAALGYRVSRSVRVAAGKVTTIAIDAPKGTVALNAIPWATAWLDGELIGETPIGNISATAGTHQVVFRHPTLGEQRRTVTVPANGTVHLGVDFRTR